ncbi:hypothetical protein GGR51DRAFT_131420 [Nemania sp. FL0031]|nr:hypothetical protein GGR51DRAFT_131420 [Nemania sp. FL0031]
MTVTMISRLRSRSSTLLNRLFHQHEKRNVKPAPTQRLPTGSPPLSVLDEKKALSHITVESAPPAQLVDADTISRPIGTLEMFFKRLGDAGASANREHAAFFTVLQVHFPSQVTNPEDYIARAWEVVGQRFPALRAEVSPPDETEPQGRSKFTVRPFDKDSFQKSFSVHPDCPNVDVLFAEPSPIRSTATCYWLPGPGQLVLRTSHWRADGFGQVLLTDVFMTTLASILERGLDAPLEESVAPQPQDVDITPGLEDLIRKYVNDPPAEAADAEILSEYISGLFSSCFGDF